MHETMTNDPLLQPYQLKHLTLQNRIMITSHEPAYPEDGDMERFQKEYEAYRQAMRAAMAEQAQERAQSLREVISSLRILDFWASSAAPGEEGTVRSVSVLKLTLD